MSERQAIKQDLESAMAREVRWATTPIASPYLGLQMARVPVRNPYSA